MSLMLYCFLFFMVERIIKFFAPNFYHDEAFQCKFERLENFHLRLTLIGILAMSGGMIFLATAHFFKFFY